MDLTNLLKNSITKDDPIDKGAKMGYNQHSAAVKGALAGLAVANSITDSDSEKMLDFIYDKSNADKSKGFLERSNLPTPIDRELNKQYYGIAEERKNLLNRFKTQINDTLYPKLPDATDRAFLSGFLGEEREAAEYNKKVSDAKAKKADFLNLFRGTPFERVFDSQNNETTGMPLKKQDPIAELMEKHAQYKKNAENATSSATTESSKKEKPVMYFENGEYAAKQRQKAENKTDLSAKDAAEMADRSYNIDLDKKDYQPEELKLGEGWHLIDQHKGKEGLVIHIYVRGDGEDSSYKGPKEYAIVNKGTTMTKVGDWINNLQQPIGLSTDMHESIDYAKEFARKAKRENCKVTFVGHSKGGAEAAANAIATNCDAIIFNSAELSVHNYRHNGMYTGNIYSYVVAGEPLDVLNKTLFRFGPNYITDYLPTYSINPIDNHSMDAVISGLDRQKFKQNDMRKKGEEIFK